MCVSDLQKAAFHKRALKDISEEEFKRRLQISDTEDARNLARQILDCALREHDSDAVEYGLVLLFIFGFSEDFEPTLRELVANAWHHKHEDVVTGLDRLRMPVSVGALYDAARVRHSYLDYDEAYALAVKAIWGLGNIGTDLAKQKLALLLQSDVEVIRVEAAKQLSRLAAERTDGE